MTDTQHTLMLDLFIKGGPLMYPLLLCSIATLTIGIERGIHFARAGRKRGRAQRIHDLVESGKMREALELAHSTPGPVAAIMAESIAHHGAGKAMLEEVISLKGSKELRRLHQNLHVLELIGRMAPLVGLLGTVLGMLAAFRQVADLKGGVDPSMLASGIWEALITTAAGMSVAIPAMILHHFFEDRVRTFAHWMKHYGSEMVKHLGERP